MNFVSSAKNVLKPNHRHPHNNPVSNTCGYIVFFSCTLLLCFIIAINAVYETPLFILGINFIYGYQNSQPYNFLHFIQNVFSLLCNPIGVGTILVVYYIMVKRKLLLLVHLSYFFICLYVMALLKQSFQQSRPIWVNSKIQKWEWFCPKDFGNPSGHSFAVTMLYEPIVSDTIGYGKHKLWAAFLLLICIMVPISRMYLGVHSANQILFGLALGQIFLNLYKYIYQRYLYILFWNMLMKHHKIRKLIISIFLHIGALIVPIIFYQINLKQRPVPQHDINNLNEKCSLDLTGKEVQAHMLTSCATVSFYFGIFYGFVLLMDTPNYRKYLLGLWAFENMKKKIIKLGIYLVCAVGPMYLFQILAGFFRDNPVFRYLILSISSLMFGLGLSYFAPIMTHKCKVMVFLPGHASDYENKLQQLA